jgi:hypothetical protein
MSACVRNDSANEEKSKTSSVSLPEAIRAAQLPDSGDVRAFLTIDEDGTSPQIRLEMSRVGDRFEYVASNLSLEEHSFKIEFEFIFNDNTVVQLANSTVKRVPITSGTNPPIEFTGSEYAYVDSDGDGFSNLQELENGTEINAYNYLLKGKAYGIAAGFQLQLNGVDVDRGRGPAAQRRQFSTWHRSGRGTRV